MKIYQIEVSNICNLTCGYCPHPVQTRPKGLMDLSTFEKSIELLIRCGQRRAFLHNFGEPLLHPDLPRFISHATHRGVTCSFYTNGVLLDKPMLQTLIEAGLREICVSEHTRDEINRVQALIRIADAPIRIVDTFRPTKARMHDWAGQTAGKGNHSPSAARQTGLPVPCVFEINNAIVVLWDGRINICCIDGHGTGISGTVDDYLAHGANYVFRPAKICATCTLMRHNEALE